MPVPRRKLLQAAAAMPLLLPQILARARAEGHADGMRGIRGSVTVNGTPAQFRTPVRPGDTVRTGPVSEAVFVVGDNAFMLRANSHVAFGSGGTTFLRMVTGGLLSVFGRGPRRLETPTASIGIRGTGCYIEAEPEQTYFCLCYGTADIEPLAQPGQSMQIASRHHDTPVMIHGAGVQQLMEVSAVKNHSDAELTLIEALAGRKPPFAGSGYGAGSDSSGGSY